MKTNRECLTPVRLRLVTLVTFLVLLASPAVAQQSDADKLTQNLHEKALSALGKEWLDDSLITREKLRSKIASATELKGKFGLFAVIAAKKEDSVTYAGHEVNSYVANFQLFQVTLKGQPTTDYRFALVRETDGKQNGYIFRVKNGDLSKTELLAHGDGIYIHLNSGVMSEESILRVADGYWAHEFDADTKSMFASTCDCDYLEIPLGDGSTIAGGLVNLYTVDNPEYAIRWHKETESGKAFIKANNN